MRFEYDEIYHVYNRTFSKEKCFATDRHYQFFWRKLASLRDWCDILAYCLMPNHFHVLILVCHKEGMSEAGRPGGMQVLPRKLGNVLSSYTQAFNLEVGRRGSLFQPRTKSQLIQADGQASICLNYIHLNPVRAGLAAKMEDWPYSSFNEYWRGGQDGICNRVMALERIGINLDKDVFYRESYGMILDEQKLSGFIDD